MSIVLDFWNSPNDPREKDGNVAAAADFINNLQYPNEGTATLEEAYPGLMAINSALAHGVIMAFPDFDTDDEEALTAFIEQAKEVADTINNLITISKIQIEAMQRRKAGAIPRALSSERRRDFNIRCLPDWARW